MTAPKPPPRSKSVHPRTLDPRKPGDLRWILEHLRVGLARRRKFSELAALERAVPLLKLIAKVSDTEHGICVIPLGRRGLRKGDDPDEAVPGSAHALIDDLEVSERTARTYLETLADLGVVVRLSGRGRGSRGGPQRPFYALMLRGLVRAHWDEQGGRVEARWTGLSREARGILREPYDAVVPRELVLTWRTGTRTVVYAPESLKRRTRRIVLTSATAAADVSETPLSGESSPEAVDALRAVCAEAQDAQAVKTSGPMSPNASRPEAGAPRAKSSGSTPPSRRKAAKGSGLGPVGGYRLVSTVVGRMEFVTGERFQRGANGSAREAMRETLSAFESPAQAVEVCEAFAVKGAQVRDEGALELGGTAIGYARATIAKYIADHARTGEWADFRAWLSESDLVALERLRAAGEVAPRTSQEPSDAA